MRTEGYHGLKSFLTSSIWILALATMMSSCRSDTPDLSGLSANARKSYLAARAGIESEKKSYKGLEGILQKCRKAHEAEVFEGLPHQNMDRLAWKKEKQRQDIFVNDGYDFYTPPFSLWNSETFISGVLDKASFKKWSGPKLCGGFHPDILLKFQTEDDLWVETLICFGCSEAIFHDGKARVRVDILPSPASTWKALLKRSRKNRPETSEW